MQKAFLVCCILASAVVPAATVRAQGTGYVYAYFKGGWPTGGHSGVFMSYSADGYTFQELNGGNAVLQTQGMPGFDGDEDQMRDPSVVYGPNPNDPNTGVFHMVWTTAATEVNRNIGYAWSEDLETWNDVQLIELWDPIDTPNITHTWAPEIEYDPNSSTYEVVFTANPYANLNGNDDHLYLWSITTTDFVNFTAPQEFYDGGVTVIDGDKTYVPATGTYVMPMEDAVSGQPNDISIATSTTGAPGTWTKDPNLTVDIFAQGTEGPSLIQIDGLWHLYFDYYGPGILGLATSPDLVNWTESSSLATLPDGRHGTVFAAPNDSISFDLFSYSRSDLDEDEDIDADDWDIFYAAHLTSGPGDFNGNGVNDYADFVTFQGDYDTFNGLGSFQAMQADVPEPGSVMIFTLAFLCFANSRSH